jgi:hypothetical protein
LTEKCLCVAMPILTLMARFRYYAAVRMNAVSQWLKWQGLDLYANRFHTEGYDDMDVLKELDEAEVEEVIEELEIPRGHMGIMRAALIDLGRHGWSKRVLTASELQEKRAQAATAQPQEAAPENQLVVLHGAETDREVVETLFRVAMDEEHPGIDVNGIARMKELMESGQFTESYYIKMWIRRLQDVKVTVQWSRRVAFTGAESEQAVFDKLLEVALAQDVGGVDSKTVRQMRQNVEGGRFTLQHYIEMWTARLQEAGIPVFLTAKEAKEDTKQRMKGHEKRAAAAVRAAKDKEAERVRQQKEAEAITARHEEADRQVSHNV